jgi:hypothetical protein
MTQASGLDGAPDDLDLIVANPPYVAGDSGRAYKDGGDLHGARLSLDWAVAGMGRLAPGGRIILYTGSAILDGGVDQFHEALKRAVHGAGCLLRYRNSTPTSSRRTASSRLCRRRTDRRRRGGDHSPDPASESRRFPQAGLVVRPRVDRLKPSPLASTCSRTSKIDRRARPGFGDVGGGDPLGVDDIDRAAADHLEVVP